MQQVVPYMLQNNSTQGVETHEFIAPVLPGWFLFLPQGDFYATQHQLQSLSLFCNYVEQILLEKFTNS